MHSRLGLGRLLSVSRFPFGQKSLVPQNNLRMWRLLSRQLLPFNACFSDTTNRLIPMKIFYASAYLFFTDTFLTHPIAKRTSRPIRSFFPSLLRMHNVNIPATTFLILPLKHRPRLQLLYPIFPTTTELEFYRVC